MKLDPLTRANALKLTTALSPNISDGREGGTALVRGGDVEGEGGGVIFKQPIRADSICKFAADSCADEEPAVSRTLYILCLHYLNGIRLIRTRSFAVKFH